MSYQTNPILNRIKLSKGWKTSFFAAKALNYSRDVKLWFKVYLFLKVYFLVHGIRLLTSDIKIANAQTKILYLSVTKQSVFSRKSKSKWKTKSFLQNIASSFSVRRNKKARFLLYLDLQKLKKNSFFFSTVSSQKILSRAWITKPRPFSWMSSGSLIYAWRKQLKLQQELTWKKKRRFFLNNTFRLVKKKKIFSLTSRPKKEYKSLFLQKKQRNLFSFLAKAQKNFFLFEQQLVFFWSHLAFVKGVFYPQLVDLLKNKLRKKRLFLQQIQGAYKVLLKKNNFSPRKYILKNIDFKVYKKKKKAPRKKSLQIALKKLQQHQQKVFFSPRVPQKIFLWGRFKNSLLNKNNFVFFEKQILKNGGAFSRKQRAFFFRKKKAQNIACLRFLWKTRFFKKHKKLTDFRFFLWKRISQKKSRYKGKSYLVYLKRKRKSRNKRINKKIRIKNRFVRWDSQINSRLQYRLSCEHNYKNFVKLKTNVKLKYLLEDLISKYFNLTLKVKILWPLAQFKNLKFYRLLFPTHKYGAATKKTVFNKIIKSKRQHKKYLYIGQGMNNLKLTTKTLAPNVKKKTSSPIFNWWKNKSKKKNKYLLQKKKIVQMKSERRLSWSAKAPFTSELIPTLAWFIKYLEPQPVVDLLAKIIGATKKHAGALKTIETIFRTIQFKRGLGYRIALVGRINGANKSRTIFLRKLNRSRSRQTFSKNVNFAFAQARATIGTFAIKIWVYL